MEKYHENVTPRDGEYVEAYLKTHSQTKAAELCNVSRETIARAVRRAGIQLLGRKYNGKWPSKRCFKFTDEQILEAIEQGLTRQEIADKLGTHVENLAKRMKRLGVHAKKAPNKGNPANFKNIYGKCWHYIKSQDDIVKSQTDDFIYLETKNDIKKIRLKCRHCGKIIEKAVYAVRAGYFRCEHCYQKELEQKELTEKRIELIHFFYALTEHKKSKFCATCGNEFHSQSMFAKYCSAKCKRKTNGNSYRSRAKKYGVYYESGITRIKVIKRDKYICQICGKKCDSNDLRWGTLGPDFPTLDHIIPLAKGGSHTWNNVQCACGMCNSYKRDLLIV